MRKLISILFALVLVASFSLVTAVPASAADTYYVSRGADDGAGDGSLENPWGDDNLCHQPGL